MDSSHLIASRRSINTASALALGIFAGSGQGAPFEGMSTHFNGVGYPYGACGVPDEIAWKEAGMDTASGQGNPFDYVALNVFDTPGNYASPGSMGKRPLTGSDTLKMGTYRNGRNCGRWIKITFGQECDGINDGAQNQPFCRNGTGWFTDDHTGGSIHAIVFDQCSDGNAWCRDSRYHLDLHSPILNRLRKDGQLLSPLAQPTGKVDPNNRYAAEYQVTGFNNRKIEWEFVPAPAYRGEPRFWFSEASKPYYTRVIVTHLPNGIHKLQQWDGSNWKDALMEGDAGQMWILPNAGQNSFKLRIVDAQDALAMGGRTWSMDFPKACGDVCTAPATSADNLVGSGGAPIDTVAHHDTQGSSATNSVSPPTEAAIVQHGKRLDFPGQGGASGWIELASPDGRVSNRLAVAAGTADLSSLASGVWITRWFVGGKNGQGRISVF